MDDVQAARRARNEALFRSVNEEIAALDGGWGEAPSGYVCECSSLDCVEAIELPPGRYETVRANPARFVVVPGHEHPELESVVECHDRYLVVEKRDTAARVARRSDPRS